MLRPILCIVLPLFLVDQAAAQRPTGKMRVLYASHPVE